MPYQEKTSIEEEEDLDEFPERKEVYRFLLTVGDSGERLDKVVTRLLPQFSRARIQRWIDDGFVTVNGRHFPSKHSVIGDEEIVVLPQSSAEEMAYQPEMMDLRVIHEDPDIMIINKPPGLVVHPASGNWSGTLLNGLLHHFPAIAAIPRAGIVHRLDKDTSGLMVLAKTLEAQTSLVRQLQDRTVRREYLALVWGIPSPGQTINAAIGRHPRDRVKMAVSQSPHAKTAVTHYKRLSTGRLGNMDVSLLMCRLETGRTHQIRVHMQSAGFPLVGDPVYGKPHLSAFFKRQALHAQKLGLIHPVSGQEYEWQAAVPDDFAALLSEAGIIETEDEKRT